MYPEKCSRHQSGTGLPIALFIITVLSLIVLSMGQLQESSGRAIGVQIQSQRAFFAAESGAQVAIAASLPANRGDPVSCAAVPASIPDGSFAGGLSGCTASIDCPGTDPSGILTITSEASCGSPGIDQASRTVEVRLQ